jgi:23S rRNA pseudouridine1911/1915/1917 synthase
MGTQTLAHDENNIFQRIVVVHEEADFLVIDKPAGLMVHGDGRSHGPTLVDWLLEHKKVAPEVGEPWTDPKGNMVPRPGIVHRLDRDTSGLLIVAKTQQMYEWLKEQFKKRTVEKTYEALVHGIVGQEKGVVDRPIGRSGSDFRKKSAQRGALGTLRDARTEYVVLKRFPAEDITHVALYPKTGRTHQLRVHMKAIHHPILGDTLYGGKKTSLQPSLGVSGLALRAVRLCVPLPNRAEVAEFVCKGFNV